MKHQISWLCRTELVKFFPMSFCDIVLEMYDSPVFQGKNVFSGANLPQFARSVSRRMAVSPAELGAALASARGVIARIRHALVPHKRWRQGIGSGGDGSDGSAADVVFGECTKEDGVSTNLCRKIARVFSSVSGHSPHNSKSEGKGKGKVVGARLFSALVDVLLLDGIETTARPDLRRFLRNVRQRLARDIQQATYTTLAPSAGDGVNVEGVVLSPFSPLVRSSLIAQCHSVRSLQKRRRGARRKSHRGRGRGRGRGRDEDEDEDEDDGGGSWGGRSTFSRSVCASLGRLYDESYRGVDIFLPPVASSLAKELEALLNDANAAWARFDLRPPPTPASSPAPTHHPTPLPSYSPSSPAPRPPWALPVAYKPPISVVADKRDLVLAAPVQVNLDRHTSHKDVAAAVRQGKTRKGKGGRGGRVAGGGGGSEWMQLWRHSDAGSGAARVRGRWEPPSKGGVATVQAGAGGGAGLNACLDGGQGGQGALQGKEDREGGEAGEENGEVKEGGGLFDEVQQRVFGDAEVCATSRSLPATHPGGRRLCPQPSSFEEASKRCAALGTVSACLSALNICTHTEHITYTQSY